MEVAQRTSMIEAADALHLTTPAVSMQIKELETRVGLTLFDRSSKHVSLSKAGEHFILHARRILLALKEADNAILRFKRLDIGQLTKSACLPRRNISYPNYSCAFGTSILASK